MPAKAGVGDVSLRGDRCAAIRDLTFDRTGVCGDDLIVTTAVGDVWKVDGRSNATELAAHIDPDVTGASLFEAVVTVPHDPATKGPLGRIACNAASRIPRVVPRNRSPARS